MTVVITLILNRGGGGCTVPWQQLLELEIVELDVHNLSRCRKDVGRNRATVLNGDAGVEYY